MTGKISIIISVKLLQDMHEIFRFNNNYFRNYEKIKKVDLDGILFLLFIRHFLVVIPHMFIKNIQKSKNDLHSIQLIKFSKAKKSHVYHLDHVFQLKNYSQKNKKLNIIVKLLSLTLSKMISSDFSKYHDRTLEYPFIQRVFSNFQVHKQNKNFPPTLNILFNMQFL